MDSGSGRSLEGSVAAVLVASRGETLLATRQPRATVTLEGFEGDKHKGFTRRADARTPQYRRGTPIRNDRQISIVSEEELRQIASALALPELQPEWLGANLLLRGIPGLTWLPPGTRLVFPQQAVLVVEGENLPCRGPGELMARLLDRTGLDTLFPKAALHRRGVVACVERAGWIGEGEPVRADIPFQPVYPPNRE